MTATPKSNDCHFSTDSIRAELERLQAAFGAELASLHLQFHLCLGELDTEVTAYHGIAGHSRPGRTIAEALAHLGIDKPAGILRGQAANLRREADRLETLAGKLAASVPPSSNGAH